MLRKLSKRIFVLALAVLLLAGGLQAYADSSKVEEAQEGVVRVICICTSYYSTGTGFAVGELDDKAQIIITNNHVVEDNVNNVYVTITDWDGKIPAQVLYRDEVRDLAVLRVSRSLSERHPLPLLSPDELTKSQDVYCLGFPGNMDDFSDKGGDVSSTISDLTITKGSVSNPEYSTGGVRCVLTDCVINHGNSGGPMVDEFGQVVGVNSWGLDENMNCAVSIDYVMEILDELELDYVVGSSDGKAAKSGKGKGSLLIVLAALGAIAAAAVFFMKKSKKQPVYAAAPSAAPAAAVRPIQAAPSVQPVQPVRPVQPVQQAQPVQALVCRCEKGALAGGAVNSASGNITIGRDASCQVIFPQGTPGISKLHCRVSLQGGRIYLTDLGSSYGTYLTNGTKLSPNVPVQLSSGERFYLASSDTVMSVNLK